MAVLENNDFSLFSSPFDLSASLGSGSSTRGSDDSGSERGEASSSPNPRAASSSGKSPYVTLTTRKSGPVPPRAGPPSLNIDEQISRRNHPISIPVKSHLKPHVNHSQTHIGAPTPRGVSPQLGQYERPHSFPAAGWHPRGGHRLHHHVLPQRSATGDHDEEYSIRITSPTPSLPRDLPMCGDDDSLINGMHRMSMHAIHDEPRVVDISPASGYYEARKPRLRNGGLNARLYNAFRVTTKDHLSINTRSPSLRGAGAVGGRAANSFSSDLSMSGRESPYAGARAGAGSPFAGGWDTPNGSLPNFTLGGATHRSFDTSYGSSLSFVSANASFNHPNSNSPGPRAGNSCDTHVARGGNSAPNTPGLPPPFSMPGTPLSSASLPPGADIRDVMAIHGAAVADGMMMPLSPTPPFGIKYKTELCLNWINTGTCVYGNKCHFGHGDTDLRARKRVRNFKTQMCCDPAREGARRCMFNARCNFLHPSEPLRRAEPVPYFDEDYVGMLMRDFPGNDFPFGIYV